MSITPRETSGVSLKLRLSVPEHCPLSGVDGEIVSASRQMMAAGCHSIFTIRGEDGHLESVDWRHDPDRRGRRCICHAFCEEEVIPVFDHVADGRVTISVFLEEETKARVLYERLTGVVPEVEVSRLNTSGDTSQRNSMTKVDLAALTGKQREALELAVTHGYYEEPKSVTITELAEALGISRQAYSHRLKVAEGQIFSQVLSTS